MTVTEETYFRMSTMVASEENILCCLETYILWLPPLLAEAVCDVVLAELRSLSGICVGKGWRQWHHLLQKQHL